MQLYSQASTNQAHWDRLYKSNNPAFIEAVISKDFEAEKASLTANPNLSNSHLTSLANDSSPRVRSSLASRKDLPPQLLAQLLADKEEEVRVYALFNPSTDFSVFKNAVLNEKFSNQSKHLFCKSYKITESAEIFDFLWKTVKNSHRELINTLSWAYIKNYDPIDPNCVNIIHEEMRNGTPTKSVREEYMISTYIATDPEILDKLKDDPVRKVVNLVAWNPNAWVSTHDYLASKHKTPIIRIAIARSTQNNDLLNKIYHGTKNEEIRKYVEENSAFVNLHP